MKIIEGNLLDIDRGYIVHQVNTLGIMGGGIAWQIRNKWPDLFEVYSKDCKSGKLKLGMFTAYRVSEFPLYVVNLAGQEGIGGVATRYEAYEEALPILKAFSDNSDLPVYFPYGIGCGLAGGDWAVMEPILERHFPEATLVRFQP